MLLVISFSFVIITPKPVQAQTDFNQAIANILVPVWDFLKKAYEKGGAAAFQTAVRSALNKVAHDTANWIGSGDRGQQPMFVTQGWGDYIRQIGDEAAGEFLEQAVANWQNSNWESDAKGSRLNEQCKLSYDTCAQECIANYGIGVMFDQSKFEACQSDCETALIQCSGVTTDYDGTTGSRQPTNAPAVCRPSSIEARIQIAMGLVDQNRPQAPNCTASELVENWDNYYQRMIAFRDPNFLTQFSNIFNPVSNDLGIYMTLSANRQNLVSIQESDAERKLIADGGWLDMRDIAGNLTGLPGDAARKTELAEQGYINNMAHFSGDALIDAANVFLNQLALSSFNRLMSGMGKTVTDNITSHNLTNPSSDPNIRYGEGLVRESTARIIEPDFTTRGDYDILVTLGICPDRNNPGPTDCVLDDRLIQGITEKVTVAEAVQSGYLRRDWKFTTEYRESAYNLRNLQIMRKYRIVPLGWEVAAQYDRQATLGDLMSCFSATDEYNDYSPDFNVRDQAWCRGLVDPNWVLKAPLNYCAKQGYSAQVLNIDVVPSAGPDNSFIDTVQIVRADNYCADEQTCISENADGSCDHYGYCLSERLTWNFDAPSCEPIDNTCSSFISSSSGQQVAYLENTLDFADCNADSVGCKRYSLSGVYDTENGQITWSANPFANAYFNQHLSSCSSADEACSEMMRVKPGWGANLIMGADFAHDNIGDVAINSRVNNYWPIWSSGSHREAEIIDATSLGGVSLGKAIRVNSNDGTAGVYSNNNHSLIPANLNILSGETYTFSADVYLINGDKIQVVLGDYDAYVETRDEEVWRHLSVTIDTKENPISEMSFQVVGYADSGPITFAVRNMKLEMNSFDSGFSAYGAYKVYQKLMPNYLAPVCYLNPNPSNPDYRLKDNAPAVCDNFARRCNRDEVGCDLYRELSTGFSLAAQAVTSDYCDASCNGYDLYVSRASYFYSPQFERMIPENSQFCSAQAVGCSEFTNLDVVEAGGEGREYYTQLKQCIKPGADCDDFYTWVGTEESGYQLKSYVLKKDSNGHPAVTTDNSGLCSESIFNLSPSDPTFNPDCRQYYNKAGQISYRLESSTITCSANCNTYRLTENNVDTTLTQSQCVGSDRFWNSNISSCYVCKNGGTWSNQHQACLYQAIPDEGKKCNASQDGCREYNGSLGNNIRFVTSNSFDNGTEGWEGQCGDAALHSQVANSNNGNSLLYDKGANYGGISHQTDCEQEVSVSWLNRLIGTAKAAPSSYIRRILGQTVQQGKAYNLKFTASAESSADVYFAFLNGNNEISYFNADENNPTGVFTVTGNNEWRTYELNLTSLDHVVDNKEALIIVSDRDFYIDNLVLTEITDRYYLIKNTSRVPDICYYDMVDNYQGPDYNLGCSLYSDRSNNSHYLRQFSKLCQESAVGCELMIDTANYNSFKPNIWQDLNGDGVCNNDEPECVSVPGDRFFYAIYDESKRCNGVDLGCSRLGEAVSSGSNLSWSDVFKRNNPNNYDRALCGTGDAGCEAWQYTDGRGVAYFKDPGNDVCVYRNSNDPEKPGKAWYKAPVMRCDLNNDGVISGNELGTKICSSSSDCPSNRPCILDNNDYECPVSYFKTFGYGGSGSQIPVPSESVATCTSSASGCTEYIDPISSFSANLVQDPGFESTFPWNGSSANPSQTIKVESNSLYVFSVFSNNNSLDYNVRLESDLGVFVLQEDNNLSSTPSSNLTIPANNPNQRFIFHSRNNRELDIFGASQNHVISLKKVIIDYQFQQDLDKTSCNGIVNSANGCVLFNERSINGSDGVLSLSGAWNASASSDGQTPQMCVPGYCDANTLIKVRPDRTCASWLDCLTYTLDPETNKRTCYALGECNVLSDQGECMNFVSRDEDSIVSGSNFDINRLTGYSVLNRYALANMKEVGLNTNAHYDFEAASPALHCLRIDNSRDCVFDNSLHADSIVNSPNNAPTDYPAEGRAYLKVMAGHLISPHSQNAPISIQSGEDYYINFLLNTKDSGANARVIIRDYENGNELWSRVVSAPNGWERKILRIPSGELNNNSSVTLHLRVDTDIREQRYVYFDDIHIEPVLKIGEDQYAVKECRLYPSQSAISCSSRNNQVVQYGLVGYCLQHDPANRNVCLLWYPIDEITSSIKSARSQLGYQGAYPLNYCTEVDANFDLLKKKIPFYLGRENEEVPESKYCRIYDCSHDPINEDVDSCIIHGVVADGKRYSCPSGYRLFSSGWGGENCKIEFFCIPIADSGKNLYVERAHNSSSDTWWHSSGDQDDASFFIPSQPTRVTGVDISVTSNADGWYIYDQSDILVGTEAQNANPPIRVYDRNYPTNDEDQLKYVSSSNPEEVYYPACNKFVQVVDSSGVNMAWANRTSVSSAYPFETPYFFHDGDTDYIDIFQRYGRNRELVPFGAATFPDNFNIFSSPKVMLRNQYSDKINQQVFAGRPYGCSGDSCPNIGYCSLNPNVYCIYDNTGTANRSLVNDRSCGSANGTCLPLWRNAQIFESSLFNYENILKNLFLSSFDAYEYQQDIGMYKTSADGGYSGRGVVGGSYRPNMPNIGPPEDDRWDLHNRSNYHEYWYGIFPDVYNVELNSTSPSVDNTFNLSGPGIYTLTFNTRVDSEQQPLKEIFVDWGDGTSQVFVNLDHRPDASNPHKIYHYYANPSDTTQIRIKATDNWNFYGGFYLD